MVGCDTPGLISIDQAIAQLLSHARPQIRVEEIPLANASGRVLAQEINSTLNVPPFDSSVMDGYALRSSDLPAPGTRLPVSQRIAAGDAPQPLQPGSAARIFTGAPLPQGADCVVMQESCEADGEMVIINASATAGGNVRPVGCHIAAGETILSGGTRLQPQHIGLAASIGVDRIKVYEQLKVGLISTGNELVEPGLPLQAGQIYNSNHYTLKTLLQKLQCEVVDLGTIADDLTLTTDALRRASEECDLIISSGGVSVGEEDHIKQAIAALGRLELWRLNLRPGKPLAFAHVGDTPLIGLPGNPVSSFVAFCLLARPFIRKCQGLGEVLPTPLRVHSGFEQRKASGRREYLRANLQQNDDGQLFATPLPNQDSATLLSLTSADGLLCIPDGQLIRHGDELEYFPLASLIE